MLRNTLLPAVALLALVSLACSFTVNLPDLPRLETGPTVTDEINVPGPESSVDVTDVVLEFGAGKLSLSPGEGPDLLSGTATYNVPDFKPEVRVEAGEVRIRNGQFDFGGIPNFEDYTNEWDLALSPDPVNLRISAGAYQGRIELGGLSLNNLQITDGAADVELAFSSPNEAEMDTFRYETGASSVTLEGLANANFETMIFRSGAGDYNLDFSGDLQRRAIVDIKSGLSNVEIIVPPGTNARVNFTGGLANIDTHDAWRASGGDYILEGTGPRLTINIDMGAGNVTLRTR